MIYSCELIGASDFLYVLYLSKFKTILPGQYLAKTFFYIQKKFWDKVLAVGLVYFPQYQQNLLIYVVFYTLSCFVLALKVVFVSRTKGSLLFTRKIYQTATILSDYCNWTRTQNHLVCKQKLNDLASLAN